MNTIIDLNTAANITYNDQANYAISFGTNLGNTTQTIDNYSGSNISLQCDVNSITSPVRDLLIDIEFDEVDAVTMHYAGTWSNISLQQIETAMWRVSGIRSVVQYNEAMANVRYSDQAGAVANTSPEYSYTTVVNDQMGNTRTWTTGVNVLSVPVLSMTGPIIYAEDTLANLTALSVGVDADSPRIYRLYANTTSNVGSITDGTTTAGNLYIDGTGSSLRSQLTAGGLKFKPAVDLVSNVASAVQFNLITSGTSVSTVAGNIQISGTNPEISNMIARSYSSNTVSNIFATTTPYINDGPDYGQSYTVTLTSPLGNFSGTGNAEIAVTSNVWSYTGTMTQVNAQFLNMVFVPKPRVPASTGTFTYTQTRDGVLQVNTAVALTGSNVAYSAVSSYTTSGVKTFTPYELWRNQYFGSNMRVVAVGGGGGGAKKNSIPYGGGGGGGGRVTIGDWGLYTGPNVTVTINGPGGFQRYGYGQTSTDVAVNGGQTAVQGGIYTITADGGQAGGASQGGNSSGPGGNFFGGTSFGNATVWLGGGGASPNGNGTNGGGGSSGGGGSAYTVVGAGATVSPGGHGAGTDNTNPATSTLPGAGGAGLASLSGQGGNGVGGIVYIIWS